MHSKWSLYLVRSKGSDRLLHLACRLPPRLPPGRLRTIRYSNVHRTFELRSCPHGFESLLFSYENKKTSMWMSFCFVDYDLFEPPWLRLTFFEQVAELAFSTNKVHKKIFSSLNFLLYILLYCANILCKVFQSILSHIFSLFNMSLILTGYNVHIKAKQARFPQCLPAGHKC